MILHDFRCTFCDHLQESLVNRDCTSVSCKKCGQTAQRVVSGTSFRLDGSDPGYPTAYDRWARDHERARLS